MKKYIEFRPYMLGEVRVTIHNPMSYFWLLAFLILRRVYIKSLHLIHHCSDKIELEVKGFEKSRPKAKIQRDARKRP